MQEVEIIGGPHGYLYSCPHLDSTCPTCGQFFLLQTTVQELTKHLQELSKRVYCLSCNSEIFHKIKFIVSNFI